MLFFGSLVVSAALISAVLTAVMVQLAPRWGLVDAPDGHRKLQSTSIPLGGGVAIVLTITIAAIALAGLPTVVRGELWAHWRFVAGLAGACGLMGVVGLLDDSCDLRGRHKLFAQILSTGLIVAGGLSIRQISLFGTTWELGLLSFAFTVAWLLGAINAFNLIDGLDGLAGTVGVILATSLGLLAFQRGLLVEASLSAVLVGALLGFLIFNWSPAKIYLGDAGSMPLGLLLGVMAMRVSLKETTTTSLAVPVVLWAVLFFDVAIAILRRQLTGQSIYSTDRSHLHHVLRRRGYSVPGVVAVIGLACAACCLGGATGDWLHSDVVAILPAFAVLVTLVACDLFGRSELALFYRWICRFLSSWLHWSRHQPAPPEPMISRFHGDRAWEQLWEELVTYSERFDLGSVRLNVSAPAIGEEFHASWKRKDQAHEPRTQWHTDLPLLVGHMVVGRLTVSGQMQPGTALDSMSELLSGLKPFQLQMEAILSHPGGVVTEAILTAPPGSGLVERRGARTRPSSRFEIPILNQPGETLPTHPH